MWWELKLLGQEPGQLHWWRWVWWRQQQQRRWWLWWRAWMWQSEQMEAAGLVAEQLVLQRWQPEQQQLQQRKMPACLAPMGRWQVALQLLSFGVYPFA